MPIQSSSLFVRSSSLSKGGTELIPTTALDLPTRDTLKSSIGGNASPPRDLISDLELMPLVFSSMDNSEEYQRLYTKIGIFSILATLLLPKSLGSVRLASSNPRDRPKVDFGILSDPTDYAVARTAVRLALKMGEEMKAAGFPILRNLTFSEERQQKDINDGNDEEIDDFIRQRIRTTYHYASTCRMAPEDDAKTPGVVDDELRVYGVSGLRVCDASVFPQILSAHLQAPVAMVAERCADFILKGL